MMEINVIDNDGVRLDKYLMEKMDASRSKIQKLIDNENILVNGKVCKSSYVVKIDDIIEIISMDDEEINVEAEDIRLALAKVYKDVFPLKSTEDIVGLNEIQCGNPGLYAIDSTNAAMAGYMRTLFTAEEAAELGIGNVYEKWW